MREKSKEGKKVKKINVNLDLDYDKLATAIIKAQNSTEMIEEGEGENIIEIKQPKKEINNFQKLGAEIKTFVDELLTKIKEQEIVTRIFSTLIFVFFLCSAL